VADGKLILAINPGSTSTKIAVYEDKVERFRATIEYPAAELAKYPTVAAQYEMRKETVLEALKKAGIELHRLNAIAARGAPLPPLKAGAYRINDAMVDRLVDRPVYEHASNVAPLIGHELGKQFGIPAYIYDGTTVDELIDEARLSGAPALPRRVIAHVLNMRAQGRKAAEKLGKPYEQATLIVTHLGGGITSSVQQAGRMVDVVATEEGPFSADRAGGVPSIGLMELCYSGEYPFDTMSRMLRGEGGLIAYLGTSSAIEVERRIATGDRQAGLVFRAMAYQVAKSIGELATVVSGRVDAIVLTGGMAHSRLLSGWITERVRFIAPVEVMAGENELESLALGVLRVLTGEEAAREYDPG
jgi:butyrate kinase